MACRMTGLGCYRGTQARSICLRKTPTILRKKICFEKFSGFCAFQPLGMAADIRGQGLCTTSGAATRERSTGRIRCSACRSASHSTVRTRGRNFLSACSHLFSGILGTQFVPCRLHQQTRQKAKAAHSGDSFQPSQYECRGPKLTFCAPFLPFRLRQSHPIQSWRK